MKKVVYVLFFITASLQSQNPVPQKGLDAITAASLDRHVNFIASDAMQGRNTPGPELDSCAAYISGYFKKHGISTPEASSYFQEFFVMKTRLGEPNTLVLTTGGEAVTYEIKTDFVPLYLTANAKAEGNIVFTGYGITAPEYGYDDYNQVDVKDRIVLVFTHEPQENDSTSVFDGKRPTDYSKLLEKAVNARNHGAVGMLVVTDPNNHRFLRPPNTWPSLMRNAPKDAVPLTLDEKIENKVVAMQIGKNLAEAIMSGTGT